MSSDTTDSSHSVADREARLARRIRRTTPWLKKNAPIPKHLAESFVSASAWWLTHSSGFPVQAAGLARHIHLSEHHGWALKRGGNTFLIGKALLACRDALNTSLAQAAKGQTASPAEVHEVLCDCIRVAVINYKGEQYRRGYRLKDGRLVFGAHAIDLDDAVRFILRVSGASKLFSPR
jgi:hypothetical protein